MKIRRASITPLEIAVIAGASSNTSINYQIQVMANQMLMDISVKDQLMGLLDKSIENSEQDMITWPYALCGPAEGQYRDE
jgi:hypothetical protein